MRARRLARVADRMAAARGLLDDVDHGDVSMTVAEYDRVTRQLDADRATLRAQWASGTYRGRL